MKSYRKLKIIVFLSLLLISTPCWGGVDFNGDADFLNCGNNASLNITGNLTLACWIYPNDKDAIRGIISKYGSTDQQYLLRMDTGGSLERYQFLCRGLTTSNVLSSTEAVENVWIHVTGVWDGSDLIIYLNGSSDNSASSSGTIDSTTQAVSIGEYDSTYYFDGVVSEVAIWDTALTPSEVSLLANSRVKGMPLQIQPSSLKGYWPLDDYPEGHGTLASTTWIDRSGNGNDGSGVDADGDSDVVGESVLSYP